MITRYTAIGLEDGGRRTLIWRGGVLTGDDDLKERFERAWAAVDHEAYRNALPDHSRSDWEECLAEKILKAFFAELLDFERASLRTEQGLQEWADAWNSHEGNTHHYTAEEMRKMDEDHQWHNHHGPPYEWDEIEAVLRCPPKRRPNTECPGDVPKCLECLGPMEWIWFVSGPKTWEMLCGRAGWTPVCRKCRAWRQCQVSIMN